MKELIWLATSEPCGKVLEDQKVDLVIVTARLLQDQEQLDKYLEQQAEVCRVFPGQTFYDLGSYL